MKRTVPGILLAAGWLLLLVLGSFQLFWAAVLLICMIGAREFCRMTFGPILYETDRIVLALLICFPVLAALFAHHPGYSESVGLFLGFVGLTVFIIYHYSRFENPLQILYRTTLGLVFIGFLAAHLPLLHASRDGVHWLIILTAITAGSDTGAYLVGSRWGRRKLCPHISPKKTIEGAVGGIGAGVLLGLLFSLLFPVSAPFYMLLPLAVALSVVGMYGDLLESVIKRGAGSKDSGSLLGGHGGVLDRVDSLFLAAPVLYYTLIYTGF